MHGFADVSSFQRTGCALLIGLAVSMFLGCRDESSSAVKEDAVTVKPYPVRLIVVDDEPLAAVLQREWNARMDGELQLQAMTSEQLESAKQLLADMIIYPSSCLGTLAQHKLITPPSKSVLDDPRSAQRDVFELQQNVETGWGRQTMAFSFGSPQLVLVYRADLLRKRQLKPPTTWEAYQQLAEQLTRAELGELAPGEDQAWSAVCEPLGPGWASKVLLARAASYASHPSQFSVLFDYTSMEPLIAGPPFVRALEELIAAAKLGPEGADPLTPAAARRAVMSGQAAMSLCWPSHASSEGEPVELAANVELGFAPLPGATTAFNAGEQIWTPNEAGRPIQVPLLGVAGRLGSVVQNARRPLEAAGLLALLSGPDWSERLSPASSATTLFRTTHLKAPRLWTDASMSLETSQCYAEVVQETQSQPAHLCSLRIPGALRYMAALDEAVLSARSGQQEPAAALTAVAEAWSAITSELGLEQQKEAYTLSLGLQP